MHTLMNTPLTHTQTHTERDRERVEDRQRVIYYKDSTVIHWLLRWRKTEKDRRTNLTDLWGNNAS